MLDSKTLLQKRRGGQFLDKTVLE